MDILNMLVDLADTPLAGLLVVGGIFFLFISIGGQITEKNNNANRKWAAIIGSIFLFTGVSLFVIPLITTLSVSNQTYQVVRMRPACATEYTVSPHTPIELRYGTWYSQGLDLAKNNADHLTVILTIDGRIISGKKMPIQSVTEKPHMEFLSCDKLNIKDGFGTFYVTYIDSLTPGEHFVGVEYIYDAQITDGYDEDNDGNVDLYGPGTTLLEFTLNVKP